MLTPLVTIRLSLKPQVAFAKVLIFAQVNLALHSHQFCGKKCDVARRAPLPMSSTCIPGLRRIETLR